MIKLDWLDYLLEKGQSVAGYTLLFYGLINLGAQLRVTWCGGYTTQCTLGLKLRLKPEYMLHFNEWKSLSVDPTSHL